jgi:hypothetical protein
MVTEHMFSVELAGGITVKSDRMPKVGPAGELTVDWPDEPARTVVYSPHAWVSFTYDTPDRSTGLPAGHQSHEPRSHLP